jgi:hypothetical protein
MLFKNQKLKKYIIDYISKYQGIKNVFIVPCRRQAFGGRWKFCDFVF